MLDLPVVPQVDQTHHRGPFDVIGDVHGCLGELQTIFDALGYLVADDGTWRSPAGRVPVFVGDLVDRGPDSVGVLRLVMRLVHHGAALAVPGNHDLQLLQWLEDPSTPLVHGLETTVAEFEDQPRPWREDVRRFLDGLPSHVVLDAGDLVVAHTGLAEVWHGRESREVRRLAAYGVASGEPDAHDRTQRHAWLAGYRGEATVVYGHTVVPEAIWQGRTIDIDTGCVYGGALTALRWPERDLVSVPAARAYAVQAPAMAASS